MSSSFIIVHTFLYTEYVFYGPFRVTTTFTFINVYVYELFHDSEVNFCTFVSSVIKFSIFAIRKYRKANEMPPKKAPAPSKKAEQKKKEKVIEVFKYEHL